LLPDKAESASLSVEGAYSFSTFHRSEGTVATDKSNDDKSTEEASDLDKAINSIRTGKGAGHTIRRILHRK
jgi:hypothetical protein